MPLRRQPPSWSSSQAGTTAPPEPAHPPRLPPDEEPLPDPPEGVTYFDPPEQEPYRPPPGYTPPPQPAMPPASTYAPPGAPPAYGSAMQPQMLGYASEQGVRYGGFWIRFVAVIIDTIVLIIPNIFFQYMANSADLVSTALVWSLMALVLNWFYYPWMESSSMQGTFGKRALGLRVIDRHGNRISFGHAIGRNLAKILSGIFFIGYIMAGFTERKQGLHDLIAGTMVVHD